MLKNVESSVRGSHEFIMFGSRDAKLCSCACEFREDRASGRASRPARGDARTRAGASAAAPAVIFIVADRGSVVLGVLRFRS